MTALISVIADVLRTRRPRRRTYVPLRGEASPRALR